MSIFQELSRKVRLIAFTSARWRLNLT